MLFLEVSFSNDFEDRLAQTRRLAQQILPKVSIVQGSSLTVHANLLTFIY